MKPRLLLHCNALRGTFCLAREGEAWRRLFTDLTAALDHAATIVPDETPITIYDATGQVILESVVAPQPDF